MNNQEKKTCGAVALFSLLHLLCCGVPLLLLSGVSLSFVAPQWPPIGAGLAVLGVVGFIWYLKRDCATCPRNKGRCMTEGRREPDKEQ